MAHVNPFTVFIQGGRDFISGQDVNVLAVFGLALGLGAVFLPGRCAACCAAEAAG